MTPLVVYTNDGKILRHGNYCPAAIAPDGELQIEGVVTNITLQYVDVSQSPPVVADMPERPSESHEFDFGTRQWVLNVEEAWRRVRQRRGELLAACDWTQLPDVSDTLRAAWAGYRQALRDITSQADPLAIIWPIPPA